MQKQTFLFGLIFFTLSAAAPARAVDLALLLGNSGFEDDLVHSQWTATKPTARYKLTAPVVNAVIVPEGAITAVTAPVGSNFVGIRNLGDGNVSGKLVHDVVAGPFPAGTTFEVTVFANRGRLDNNKDVTTFPTVGSASRVNVSFFGWGSGTLPVVAPSTDNFSRRPILTITQAFTDWGANGTWAAQTFMFTTSVDLEFVTLAITGNNRKQASYVAFDVD